MYKTNNRGNRACSSVKRTNRLNMAISNRHCLYSNSEDVIFFGQFLTVRILVNMSGKFFLFQQQDLMLSLNHDFAIFPKLYGTT